MKILNKALFFFLSLTWAVSVFLPRFTYTYFFNSWHWLLNWFEIINELGDYCFGLLFCLLISYLWLISFITFVISTLLSIIKMFLKKEILNTFHFLVCLPLLIIFFILLNYKDWELFLEWAEYWIVLNFICLLILFVLSILWLIKK